MSVIGSNILAGASGQAGYFLTNSLRFRSSASAYLNRTGGTATNAQKATYSFWFKRGALTTGQWIFTGGAGSATTLIGFNGSSDALSVLLTDVSGEGNITTAVFRDPSAWYHFVIAIDTTQATTADRAKIYVNGVLQTVTVSNGGIGLNANWGFNTANTLNIGRYTGGSSYTDGYLAEVNFIDGQALTPSSFGETSTSTGVWIPKKFVGTYGTNGFYLPFTNTASTSTLGNDFSGNSNTWTVNNISLTAGSTYDSMTDVPTLTSATAANYAVMNPLIRTTNNSGSISQADGNLSSTIGSYANTALATIGVTSGKWYWEMTPTATNNGAYFYIGIVAQGFNNAAQPSGDPLQWAYYAFNGNKNNNNNVAYGASYTTNDVIGVALDMDAGTLTFYKNGASQGVAYSSGLTGYTMFPMCSFGNTGTITVVSNFGQRPFAYTPPTGFVRLNTFNLPTPTIGATAAELANEYFDATLYTGNGSTNTITNSGSMQPDLLWTKRRSAISDHYLQDSVRGVNKALFSDLTDSEYTITSTTTTLNNNGFSFNGGESGLNANTSTYVAWQWRASNATAVTNTAGSITSTVSANTSAGFSIVTYTGTGVNATVGHGLGATPSMVTVKCRSAAGESWHTYHVGLSSLANTVYLNGIAAQGSFPTCFNSMSTLNSTVFSLGTDGASNGSGRTYVAYCFAPVAGYSAFGSYTGNGSADGPFIFTGFRPRYIMIKSTVETSNWFVYDTARDTYNTMDSLLFPSDSGAEYTDAGYALDALSNGFKIRATGTYGGYNNNGNGYIYMAFAESPFRYANAR